VKLAYAHSTQTIFYIMAGVMAAVFVVAVRWMARSRLEAVEVARLRRAEHPTGNLSSMTAW
jgi:hypothetical protein